MPKIAASLSGMIFEDGIENTCPLHRFLKDFIYVNWGK
jgi:hypothetical protein